RALALRAIEWDASFDDEDALLKMAQDSQITLDRSIGGNRVLVNGKDVSERIRERDVSEGASKVSVHPKVREWMVARQREMRFGADNRGGTAAARPAGPHPRCFSAGRRGGCRDARLDPYERRRSRQPN